MVKLWAWRVHNGLIALTDVPERYLDAVKAELGIED